MTPYRSGFIAVVGRPNVGKSTLINALAGEKIVIATAKPQTTRQRIRVILTTPTAQIILYDTPGLHKPQHKLGEEMNKVALNTLELADAVLWLTDATQPMGKGDQWVFRKLQGFSGKVLVAVNKIDLVPSFDPQKFLEGVKGQDWPVIQISALTGAGITELIQLMEGLLPTGPQYYPEEMLTDQPESIIISDLIREGIINQTDEEVPHSVAVVVEEIKDRSVGKRGRNHEHKYVPEPGQANAPTPTNALGHGTLGHGREMIYIRATILVERDSQKKIVIGRGGKRLKEIGTAGRKTLEEYLGAPVYLDLWVKTRKDWRDSLSVLRELGYVEKS